MYLYALTENISFKRQNRDKFTDMLISKSSTGFFCFI